MKRLSITTASIHDPATTAPSTVQPATQSLGEPKKVNGTLTQGWLYGDGLRIIAEMDGSGTIRKRFVYGTRLNVPDYMTIGDATYRIISDTRGSPRLVVDTANGAVAQQLTYDEFGQVLLDSNPGFQPFGFAGGLYDSDTGLLHFGAREYDARIARWTTPDPTLFAGGTNLYAYSFDDPVNFIDPSGHEPVTTSAVLSAVAKRAAIGALAGAAGNLLAQGVGNHKAGRRAFACIDWKSVGVSALAGAGVGVVAPAGPLAAFGVGGGFNALQYLASDHTPGWIGSLGAFVIGGGAGAAGTVFEQTALSFLPRPALRFHEGTYFRLQDTRQLTGPQSFGLGTVSEVVTNYDDDGGCPCK